MFKGMEIVDDSNEKPREKRMVFVGKLGPGISKVVVTATFAKTIETIGEDVSDVKSA